MNPKVYIVLVNYNGWKDTIECVENLLKLHYNNFSIVIVDNASTDGSLNYLHRWLEGDSTLDIMINNDLIRLVKPFEIKPLDYKIIQSSEIGFNHLDKKIIVIESKFNGGFAYGNNLGIEFIREKVDADFVWFLNNDTVVDRESINFQIAYYSVESKKRVLGIIGSSLYYYHGEHLIQGYGGRYNPVTSELSLVKDIKQKDNIDYVIGASMFVTNKFIQDVGLMEEDYFLYFEELDWCIRGKQKGYDIGVCIESIIYHKEGAAIEKDKDENNVSILSDFYMFKSHKIFSLNFYKKYMLFFYIKYLLRIISTIVFKRDLKKAQVFFSTIFLNKSYKEVNKEYIGC